MTRIKRSLRNPNFDLESVVLPSWTVAKKGCFPEGRETLCCNDKVRPGDIVATIPSILHGTLRGTAVFHSSCLKRFAETVPDESDIVQESWLQIREKHSIKNWN